MNLPGHTAKTLRRALKRLTPRKLARAQLTRRAIKRFADEIGLVYFGVISRRDEDYRSIRGYTASATKVDEHYCVGTVNQYDVVLALRSDVVELKDNRTADCHWLIAVIDLHEKRDVPDFYVGHDSRLEVFESHERRATGLKLGHVSEYPRQFLANYRVFGRAGQALEIESIFTPELATVVATHFQGASFEFEDNVLYMYLDTEFPEKSQLEKILSNGTWLAAQIDTKLA